MASKESNSLAFKDNFWDCELGNFTTYELLLKKIKDNQRGTKDYLEFIKLRISAQEAYAKSLQKLSKVATLKNECGVMGRCWQNALNSSEGLGAALLKAAASAEAALHHVEEITTKQREQRKREEEDMKHVHTALKGAMNRVQTRKRQYVSKCREFDQACKVVANVQEGKEATKAQQRLQTSTQQREQTATSLTQAEEQLEEARNTWQQRTHLCYQVFEVIEEQRLGSVSNLQTLLKQLETERIRAENTILEQNLEPTTSDIMADLTKFVEDNKTNLDPPPPIAFTLKESANAGNSSGDDFDSDDGDGGVEYAYVTKDHEVSLTLSSTTPQPKPRNSSGSITSGDSGTKGVSTLQRKLRGFLPKVPSLPALKRDRATVTVQVIPGEDNSTPRPTSHDQEDTVPREIVKTNSLYMSAEYDFTEDGPKNKNKSEGEDEEEAEDPVFMPAGMYKPPEEMMRVIYDYKSQHDSDISLSAGDLVTLVRVICEEWAEVKNSSRSGFFPRAYLEPASS